MAYPPYAPVARSRRRRRVALFITIAIVIAMVALAVRYRTDERVSLDYLAMAQEVAEDERAMAASLGDLFLEIGDLERPDILARIDALSTESAALVARVEAAEVAGPVTVAHGFFLVAVGSWNEGLVAMDEAITQILDEEGEGRTGDSMLAQVFDDLSVGDRAYAGFQRTVAGIDPGLVNREYPSVAYTGGENVALFDAVAVADRLRLIRKLDEAHDVSVTVSTDPEPLGSQNDVPVVPDSDTFLVSAVITNEGNLPEELIQVRLTLTAGGEARPSIERNELIPVLGPGEATTRTFDQIDLVPGTLYELRVTATIAEDNAIANNEWKLIFIRNSAE
jgi:hypothetical protein